MAGRRNNQTQPDSYLGIVHAGLTDLQNAGRRQRTSAGRTTLISLLAVQGLRQVKLTQQRNWRLDHQVSGDRRNRRARVTFARWRQCHRSVGARHREYSIDGGYTFSGDGAMQAKIRSSDLKSLFKYQSADEGGRQRLDDRSLPISIGDVRRADRETGHAQR